MIWKQNNDGGETFEDFGDGMFQEVLDMIRTEARLQHWCLKGPVCEILVASNGEKVVQHSVHVSLFSDVSLGLAAFWHQLWRHYKNQMIHSPLI